MCCAEREFERRELQIEPQGQDYPEKFHERHLPFL